MSSFPSFFLLFSLLVNSHYAPYIGTMYIVSNYIDYLVIRLPKLHPHKRGDGIASTTA